MRKPSRRKCKVCGEYFVPKFHDIRIRWCCPEHGAILAMEEREKEKVKAAAKRIKEQKEAEKAGRNRRKERLAELRPAGYYKAQAQQAFNAYIRARDADLPCISCGETNPRICTAASGTAATSRRSVLTLSCDLKNATRISSANPAMPGPASTPPKRRRSRSNTKLVWSLVTARNTSTGSMVPTK